MKPSWQRRLWEDFLDGINTNALARRYRVSRLTVQDVIRLRMRFARKGISRK